MQFDDLVAQLQGNGTLTPDQANDLKTASRFPLNASEIVAILGGFFVVVGAIWLVGPLLEDASRLIVAGGLYLLCGLLLLATRAIIGKGQIINVGEVVEVLAALSFFAANGFLVSQFGADGETTALISAIPVAFFGGWRSRGRLFSGAIILTGSVVTIVIASMLLLNIPDRVFGFSLVAVGSALLIWATRNKVTGKFVLRAAGSGVYVTGLIMVSFEYDAGYSFVIPGLIFAIALFTYGVKKLYPVVLAVAGVGLVIATTKLITTITDNSNLQGLATLLTGVVTLSISMRQLRQRKINTPS